MSSYKIEKSFGAVGRLDISSSQANVTFSVQQTRSTSGFVHSSNPAVSNLIVQDQKTSSAVVHTIGRPSISSLLRHTRSNRDSSRPSSFPTRSSQTSPNRPSPLPLYFISSAFGFLTGNPAPAHSPNPPKFSVLNPWLFRKSATDPARPPSLQ